MAESGHPLWGDAVYGPQDKESPALRQLLHAWKLEFIHPISGESLNFCCPPPEDFIDTMLSLERCTKKVILTGMPGCGKSAVLEVLSRRGIPVWSADKAVAAQYKTGADGWHLMRQRWGSSFLHDDGSIDRTKLTELLSVQPGMRKELEKLIHPLILLSMKNFFTRASDKKAEIAVAEVPLWFETGWQRPEGASIAVIACNRNIRWNRIRKYRSWSEEKIASIESWQWSQKEKIAAADFVIQNEGSLQNLENEADVFLAALSGKTHSEEDIRKQYWRSLWK
jgi:23S rRNA pseudouridine1911/1915/1917 synthase